MCNLLFLLVLTLPAAGSVSSLCRREGGEGGSHRLGERHTHILVWDALKLYGATSAPNIWIPPPPPPPIFSSFGVHLFGLLFSIPCTFTSSPFSSDSLSLLNVPSLRQPGGERVSWWDVEIGVR